MLSSAKKGHVFDYGEGLQAMNNDIKPLNLSHFTSKNMDAETDSKTSEASGNISAQIKEAQAKSTFFDTAIFDQHVELRSSESSDCDSAISSNDAEARSEIIEGPPSAGLSLNMPNANTLNIGAAIRKRFTAQQPEVASDSASDTSSNNSMRNIGAARIRMIS
jgi:hypothetical protein